MKMKFNYIFLFTLVGFLLTVNFAYSQEDAKGCKDHPLFTRMSGYYLGRCEEKEFDAHKFYDPETKEEVTVEGRRYKYSYYVKKELKGKKSDIQVTRNYVNAIKKIGGSAYEKSRADTYLKLVKDDKETWISIHQDNWRGNLFNMYIVEKEAMVQEVVADAKSMARDISATGKVAIYGIHFDFNKADVKPESDPTLIEISKLLSQNPNLRLYVVGHTDNVGKFDYNMKLSQARANAVIQVLVSRYSVDRNRLKSYGVGPLAPVQPNKTEEGRAKNRRVELVEQ